MKIPDIDNGRYLLKLSKPGEPVKAGNHPIAFFKQIRTALNPVGSILLALYIFTSSAWAEVSVLDDSHRSIHLSHPAKRIVSLAPNVTELLFEIGAGDKIVGTVEYSDYPPAAKTIPRIGRHNALDLEAIVLLKPDLVIAWQSGNPVQQVEKLVNLGIPVYYSELRKLKDVADTLQRFGQLTGLHGKAQQAQQAFEARYRRLKKDYQHKSKIKAFYEIWNQPMMSVNGDHIINEVIELCGGENVFKSLAPLTPTVNVEAVLLADPEVIIASGVGDDPPPWLGEWDRWRQLAAVKHGHVYYVNPDYIHRQTSRILIGAERVCSLLDKSRKP